MHKLVKRVTVIEGEGENRHAQVIYESPKKENDDEGLLGPLERAVRHLLKADLIRAQEAYDRHIASVSGKGNWLFEAPENMRQALRKAEKEARKARPDYDEDENGDEGD
jgi:hypothetical protein